MSYLDLLPIAAIVPGLLASLFMLIVAICGNTKCYTHCCFKFVTVVTIGWLVLNVVDAIIFVAVNAIFYVPMFQEELRKITSLCDTALPVLQQTMDDAKVLVDTLKAANLGDKAALASAEAAMVMGTSAVTFFTECCTCFNNMLLDIQNLLTPAILMLVASLFGLWCNFGSCCSACCNPRPVETDGAKVMPQA